MISHSAAHLFLHIAALLIIFLCIVFLHMPVLPQTYSDGAQFFNEAGIRFRPAYILNLPRRYAKIFLQLRCPGQTVMISEEVKIAELIEVVIELFNMYRLCRRKHKGPA